MGDPIASRWFGKRANPDGALRCIPDAPFIFEAEMQVIADVRIEIGAVASLSGNTADQSGLRKLVERIVDGRQRKRETGARSKRMQLIGRQMPMARAKDQHSELDALARRPEMRSLEHRTHFGRFPEIAQFNLGYFLKSS